MQHILRLVSLLSFRHFCQSLSLLYMVIRNNYMILDSALDFAEYPKLFQLPIYIIIPFLPHV